FRDVTQAVDLRDQDQLYAVRDALGAEGYAVAYSSYSENGFAIKDGVQRTHQLRGLLANELSGSPKRNYLVGHSLGSGVSLSLAEQFRGQYDGALLMCGIVGGSLAQTEYLGHVRALFDVFYPGVLPGDAINVPPGTTLTLPQLIAAVSANPLGLFAIGSTAQTPLPFVPNGSPTNPASVAFQTLLGSLYGGLVFQLRGAENIKELTHGFSPFDNKTTIYSTGTPLLPPNPLNGMLAAANASVTRYIMPPPAVAYLSQHFMPTGALKIPVLTVHNTWDPVVPASIHEAALLRLATQQGATNNLVQRSYPAFGHCAIPASETLRGFHDLVAWVTVGSKPSP
ncbi:MAG: hypothetical protein ABIT38_21295, partial [Gemmatimonadaceae bacterium]